MLTTAANTQKAWLHHRMPVFIWDLALAKQWLAQPSDTIKQQLVEAARRNTTGLAWHPVSSDMSSLQFRGKQAIQMQRKGDTTPSVTSFFTKANANASPVTTKQDKRKKSSPSAVEQKKNRTHQQTKQASGTAVLIDTKSVVVVTASNVTTTTKFSTTAAKDRTRPSTTVSGDDWLSTTHSHSTTETQPRTSVPIFPAAPDVNNVSSTHNDEEYARQLQAQLEQEEVEQSRRDAELARRLAASAGNNTTTDDSRKRAVTTRTAHSLSPAHKRNKSSNKERAATSNAKNNSQIAISSFFQKRK